MWLLPAADATTTQLLPDSHPYTHAAAWTKYHLAVTQHKENETNSDGAAFDLYDPQAPVISLDSDISGGGPASSRPFHCF